MAIRGIAGAAATAAMLGLAACGGGGGGAVSFIPTPPSSPPPPPILTSQVTIFPSPTPATYASVGTSMPLKDETSSNARFGTLSTADADQVHIRYLSNGNYEIEVPGRAWDTLIPIKGMSPPSDFQYQPASSAQNAAGLFTGPARWGGYKYSEYAFWYSRDVGRQGWVAFGSPTAAADIPRAGSANYDGVVHGSADIMSTDPLSAPFYYPAQVDGTVSLAFDFGAGTLAGSMTLSIPDGMQPAKIGTFAFKDTVFSVGSQTYSGSFASSETGPNFFSGRFTGPRAEETIGSFAVPFRFTNGGEFGSPDNQVHTAVGAWVAKRP